MVSTIIIASGNQDKVAEIREIMARPGLRIKTLAEFENTPAVVEDGNTLYENALKKARVIYKSLGVPVLSDDTGLEVDYLDGAPGVFSARYAGEDATYEDNVQKLLRELRSVPRKNRSARFRTVAVFFDGQQDLSGEGTVEGIITEEPRGDGGFGYDSVFEALETKQTFGEMNGKAKNAISHRGRALRNLYLTLQQHNILS
ncbi:MAG: RdgB/HAM1 family non-canonical purine NTP pyrophosphatase [Candidatus Marinimicrobia bacterium]|nr:RdgB/HAM1 family non-canonical purine NTP pyrophosphatase [Candidatus Neomarinimicrobiota bacterium]MCF7829092.1 RdgB/HAM1 family non-canonical purine NTP pyrophosphatase [Candidatus Neomarinimicrobiota bacterium]MCF7881509.1 RdgB/HAM1 family non-canonical purine NTP pyrophosphatase [Candidatus Neomarinimicrobiota bacterium]